MADIDWNDLKIFHAVLNSGSFSAAARNLGMSQPTIGRRVRALEERFGEPLVQRTPDGCMATMRGEMLLPLVELMQTTADRVERLVQSADIELCGLVRIASAGFMGRLLAQHLTCLRAESPQLEIELVIGFGYINLDRGDADIAVRVERPQRGNLYARKLGTTYYAVYGAPGYIDAHPAAHSEQRYRECSWISFDEERAHIPSARWLSDKLNGLSPVIHGSNSSLIVDAASTGAGLAVLPSFVGDEHPGLVRVSPPLEELPYDIWLLTHRDSRQTTRVRRVTESIAKLFSRMLSDLPTTPPDYQD
ncbi:MAG: LysR family transcriptional regulator [Myxococcota bacterium]